MCWCVCFLTCPLSLSSGRGRSGSARFRRRDCSASCHNRKPSIFQPFHPPFCPRRSGRIPPWFRPRPVWPPGRPGSRTGCRFAIAVVVVAVLSYLSPVRVGVGPRCQIMMTMGGGRGFRPCLPKYHGLPHSLLLGPHHGLPHGHLLHW